MNEFIAIAAAYVIGSIPFALLLARRRGIDLRQAGSGNVGAANVMRTSGVPAGVLTMCLDIGKGTLAVLVAQRLTDGAAVPVAAGCASIVGHVYPAWLRFRGGKGVATSAGVFAVLAPVAVGIAGVVFVLTVWTTRYISLGSAAAVLSLVAIVVMSGLPIEIIVGAASSAAIVLHRHRANFARILAGTERRVGRRALEEAAR